jgi:hypothetical protein
MTAEFLWINIPLMALAFALWVGIPMWMVLRHPDKDPRETRLVPAYLRQQMAERAGTDDEVPAYSVGARRELMRSGQR